MQNGDALTKDKYIHPHYRRENIADYCPPQNPEEGRL